jgi:hypothetical protein
MKNKHVFRVAVQNFPHGRVTNKVRKKIRIVLLKGRMNEDKKGREEGRKNNEKRKE